MKRYIALATIIALVILFTIVMVSGRTEAIDTQHIIYTTEARLYATTVEGTQVLEDEAGTLWEVTDAGIADNDVVLIQLDNNNTVNDNTDDTVINLWILIQGAHYTHSSTGNHTQQGQIDNLLLADLAG